MQLARQTGFTLVELMVGLTILGILLVTALPSYSAWIMNTQIRTAAETTLSGLQLARGEAVRRNTNVEFIYAVGPPWTWTVQVAAPAQVVQTRSAGAGSPSVTVARIPAAATRLTFNSLGRIVANADASATLTQMDFDVPVAVLAATASRDLRVVIPAGGNMRMCDPTVTVVTDVRICP